MMFEKEMVGEDGRGSCGHAFLNDGRYLKHTCTGILRALRNAW